MIFSTLLTLILFSNNSFTVNRPDLDTPSKLLQEELKKKLWVDSVLQSMTIDEKIGQLFMVAAYSNRAKSHEDEILHLIENYHIGGVLFFQGGPVRQAKMTNNFQKKSKYPLMIAIDGEWGVSMRLDSTIVFPRQLTLGAIKDEAIIREMGKEIARQCRRLGIHMNLAPVADVNNNPLNPVINDRSFGEDKFNVALKSLAYMSGMQNEGVLACAKHFPGHGDTDKDSHYTLPVIRHNMSRLREIELYPFQLLSNHGIAGMMSAHMHIPAIDSTPNLAVSLSENALKDILRDELGYEGLIISDALNMKGVSDFFKPGELDLKAFQAGNDILLFPENVPAAVEKFHLALKSGEISESDITESVVRILKAKYNAGLNQYSRVEINNLVEDLNTDEAKWLRRSLFEHAVTTVRNEDNLLPVRKLDTLKIASLSIGGKLESPYQKTIDLYSKATHFAIDKNAVQAQFDGVLKELSGYDLVLVSMQSMGRFSRNNFGISQNSLRFLNQLNEKSRVILSVFGNPYSLKNFQSIPNILVFYEENEVTLHIAPQVIFGGIPSTGLLPVTASYDFKAGTGVLLEEKIRLKYTEAEDLGLRTSDFKKIDKIVEEAIKNKAMPGCQVLLAKDGKVFFHKAYGNHTYDEGSKEVEVSDIYDLASITKISATTLSLMHLYDLGLFTLQSSLSDYLSDLNNSNLKNLNVRKMLLHEAGLRSWIPFYKKTLPDKLQEYYCNEQMGCFTIPVGNNLYLRNDFPDTIYSNIHTSELSRRPEYRYSDLGFYLFKDVVEEISGMTFEEFTEKNFYLPMGMHRTAFKPLRYFDLNEIVPTEVSADFRVGLIHGNVHDQGAAMLGGVSGHAGVFSPANDLAILMQMFLNGGHYGGERFLSEETIEFFTSRHSRSNRRGLGFDKPETSSSNGPTAKSASPSTFGHSGFTGTGVWADPEYGLSYVFVSNRIHPSATNRKLISENIRTRIHQVAYDAIKNSQNVP